MDKMKNSKKTFWPYGIALFLIFMVCMIILTVFIAIKLTPENDNAYFSTRQDVDKNINDILIEQKDLENSYNFHIIDNGNILQMQRKVNKKSSTPLYLNLDDGFVLKVKITDKNNNSISVDSIRANITRFATSKFDKNIEFNNDDNIFSSDEMRLEKGDWKVMMEIKINDKIAYFEQFIVVE